MSVINAYLRICVNFFCFFSGSVNANEDKNNSLEERPWHFRKAHTAGPGHGRILNREKVRVADQQQQKLHLILPVLINSFQETFVAVVVGKYLPINFIVTYICLQELS